MPTFFRAVAFSLILLGLTSFSFAQDKGKKDENFQKIAKLSNSKKPEDQDKAYALAKDFVAAFGKDTDDKVKKIKDFVDGYEVNKMNSLLDSGKTDDAFLLGKDILEKRPDDVFVMLNLAYGGYAALTKRKDDSFGGDSITYAKQVLASFEKGALPKTFSPFKNQIDVTAWMHVIVATFSESFDPKEAAISYYHATKLDSELKTQTFLYISIAQYYEKVYEEMAKTYKEKHGTKPTEDAAMKADNVKLDAVLDRMIDSAARVVKVAEAEKHAGLEGFKTRYSQIYKFRKGNEAGMNELLTSILSTPMPIPN
jgi:hypothetical protein